MNICRHPKALIETFESRILYSADPGPAGLAAAVLGGVEQPGNGTGDAVQQGGSELVFIDSRVPDIQQLLDDLAAQQRAGRAIEIFVVGSDEDGIALIGASLAGRHDISAVHVLGHGSAGVAEVGATRLDAESVFLRAGEIAAWGDALSVDADLLLYGCDVAADAGGRSLVSALAQLTGADVAASDDLTGAAALGGDWNLEFTTGRIETAVAPSVLEQQAWSGILAISANGTVTSTSSSNTTTTPLSWSHTVAAGSNRVMFVELAIGSSGAYAQAVSYGGVGMQLVGRTSSSDPVSVEIWRLVNPTVGTANVVASFSATTAAAGGATTYNGVDQTTPVRGGILVSAHGTGTTASVTVASAPGDLVIDVQSWQGLPSGGAVGAGQSLLWSQQNGNTGGSTSEPGAASVEMSGSFGSSANWVIGAVSLKAAAGITVTPISGLTVTEGGGTAQFSVVLDSAPTANVTVSLSSSNTREGTLSASSLSFTTANWNVAQTVTVTGVDDTYIDGNTAFSVLTAAATSTDSSYSGLDASDVSLTNTDNDTVNTLVVDTTSDTADGTTTSIAALMANKGADGKISLREAIAAANNTANGPGGADRILFSIAGTGPHSISLTSALPTVTQAVIIDGSSEPDFAGTPVIELNGAGVGTFSSGILLGSGSSGSTIKGLVINRFSQSGIRIEGGSGNNLITGNYLGTDTTGLLDLGNTKWGLDLEASGGNNVIGGNSAALRNVISGNNLGGVSFNGATVTGNLLQGNYIGVGRDGTTALGNSGSGGVLVLNGASATVGGVGAGLGNLIANNTGHGVDVKLGTATILGNAIVGNSSLGIDLGDNGTVEVNDAGDADSGPNNLQNYPVLTSATYGGGRVLIVGTLNSNPSTFFRIEFFSSASGDASAHGEGQVFLGAASVTTDSSGNASFSAQLTGTGMTSSRVVSATATVDLGGGTYGGTSEFSANINSVAAGPTVSAPPTQTMTEDGSLVFSSANGNAITVGDGMAGDGRLQVALASPNGTLTLGGTAGLTIMGGANGSANMVLWGTKSALNAALNGLAFTPVGNFNGSASISVTSALAADLAGYYPFSGGSTADQAAGTMQNGSLLGNAAVVTDPTRGEVLSLDGNGDALQIDSLFGQPQNVTIGGWVNLTKQPPSGRAEFISLDDRVHIALDDAGGVKGSVQVSAGAWTDLNSNRFLAGTGWHHVMYVFDNANDVHSLYIDGSLSVSAANTNTIDYTGATTTYIGRHPTAPDLDFQGQLDDVRIYDRALTATEVAALAIDFDRATSAIAVTVAAVNDAPTFDAADFVAATSIGAGNERAYATVVQPDGKIVVAGYTHNGSSLDFVLVRYNADGTLDTGFGGGDGIVTQAIGAGDDEAYAVALQADGKILVAGRTANGGHDDFALVRYLADGSLDTSFGGGDGIVTTDFGSGSSDQARSMVVQSDGRIVLGGKTNLDIAVARYLADGTLDTSFSGDGKHTVDLAGSNDEGLGLALQADGRIIQVGSTFIGGNQDFAVLRYNTDGSLDTSFGGGDGIVTTPIGTSYDIAHSVVVQTDGKIVVGGYYGVESFNNNFAVVRYAADGSLDTTFGGGDGIATTDFGGVDVVWSLALQSDNKIVAAGGSGVTAAVVRYAADGSLDTSFSGDGMLMLPLNSGSYFCAMAVQSDGRIVLTGFTTSGSNDDVLTLGLTADGQLDTRANPGSTSLGGSVSYTENGLAVVLDSNVRIYDAELSAANNFNGATLTLLRSGGASAQDVFSATGNLAALIPGGNLVLSGVTVGTVTTHSAGTLLLTFNSSATQARINEVMNSIAYANSSDTPPASVVINWTFNDGNTGAQGTGGALTATGSTTVSITAVNDAPVVTTTGTALAYTENAAATAVDSGLTVSDVDTATLASATVSITSGFVTGQDTLAFTNQNGITGSWSAGTGVLTLTGSATVANYQTALRSVTYVNTSDNPSLATRTVAFAVNDGSTSSSAATRDIAITALNDAPFVTTTGSALAYTENAAATAVDSGLTVSDVDTATLASATVSLTGGFVTGQDVLAFSNQNGITGSWNDSTGVLTLTGSTTLANYQTALRSVTYVNTSDNPSTATRTVSFVTSDGSISSTAATRDITITAVNDAPVVTTSGSALAYTENAAATAVDSSLTVSDVDNANLASATVSLTSGFVTGQDVLAFTDQSGITGSWNAGSGVLTLTGSATLANYQTALRSITYVNTSDNPSTATRTVSFVTSDGSASSAAATRDITVTAVNDAPVVITSGSALAYTENAAATAVDSGLTVSDVDTATLASATVSLTGGFVTGQDVLAFSNQNGITGSWNDSTGVLTLTGSTTLANYQTALRSVTYFNSSDAPSTTTRTIAFAINDGSTSSTAATRDITITAVNDAPVVTTTSTALTYTENDTATAVDSGLTVSDVDTATLASATVSLTGGFVTGQDVLAFTDQNGITGSWNAGTGVLTLTGSATVANYQTALRSVTYLNSSEAPSTVTRTVAFAVNDGSISSAVATRDITITAINDAPVLTTSGSTLAYTENAAPTAVDSGLTVSDADADTATFASATVSLTGGFVTGQDVLAFTDQNSITGSWNDSTGVLTLSGSATLANYQTALRSITYVNTSDNPSTTTRTVAFVVNDGSTSSSAATRDITITAINDAPVFTGLDDAPTYTSGRAPVVLDADVQVFDAELSQANFDGVTLLLQRSGGANGQDVFSATGTLSFSGGTVSVGATAIGSVTTNSAGTLRLTFNADASNALVNSALQQIAYSNSGGQAGSVQIDWTLSDGNTGAQGAGGTLGAGGSVSVSLLSPPGITVSAISGATTEAGGTASFTVVLDALPTGDVSIAVSSSNPQEGTVSTSLLSFTAANWNVAQTVTITGIDDTVVDGNRAYTVVLGAANSTDAAYNGLKPADVAVTNSDNDTQSTIIVTTASDAADAIDGDTSSLYALLQNKGSDGLISLREAIIAANNSINGSGGADRIHFGIAGTGEHLINLAAALPAITDAVILDASTDDSFAANSNKPAIVLDGNNLAASGLELTASADGSTIRGLVIRDFDGSGIVVQAGSDGNTIAGNYIGRLNPAGADAGVSEANTQYGVYIAGANNTVGGPAAADGNLISGNLLNGVHLAGAAATGNTIQGNRIGTNSDGTAAIGNQQDGIYAQLGAASTTVVGNLIAGNADDGIEIVDASSGNVIRGNIIGLGADGRQVIGNGDNGIVFYNGVSGSVIGGTTPAARNIISGNTGSAIVIDGAGGTSTTANTVAGNLIGTDSTGLLDRGNGATGVVLKSGAAATTVGGSIAGAGNVIAGNLIGILIDGETTDANLIQGNRIGVGLDGTTAIGNTGDGVRIANGADDTLIGGTTAAAGNIIANHTGSAINIASADSTGNALLGNRIYASGALGIDLGGDGISSNDAGDADTGANNRQNAPVLTSALTSGTDIALAGMLNSLASTHFRIEFFASASPNLSGYGEGQIYLGFVDVLTDASGDASFNPTFSVAVPTGHVVSSTATRLTAGLDAIETSEFSVSIFTNVPVITSDGGGSTAAVLMAENTALATTVTATDPDGAAQNLSFTLSSGADKARFAIDASTGVLSFLSAPDYETPLDTNGDNIYEVVVQVADGTGAVDLQAIAVTVTPVNETPPAITSSAAASVAENTTAVLSVTASDADRPAETLSYSLAGGPDVALFQIDASSGALSFKLAPNFEAPADAGADNIYNVTVLVSDGTLSSTQALAITVTAVNDNTPAITSSATASVAENTTAVLTVTASDADRPAETLSYSLAGGPDVALFQIDASSGALSFKLAPNFEAPADAGADNLYNVTVQVSDGTLSSSQALSITVTPVNDNTPAITSSATASIAENTTAVLTVTASDADLPTQSLSYSLAGGADAALFQINASTGALSFKLAPDYEAPADANRDNVYELTVQVSDGTFSSSQALAITVTPVNDTTPTITSSATASVAENATAVLTVTASDADLPTQSLSYSLAGGADAALFQIDASTGALSFKLAPDYETPLDANGDNVYNVTVQVSDGTLSSTQAIAITVTPVNDNTPAITSGATASVAENTTAVLTVTASDADLPTQSLSYSLAGGADAALFAIDASTGVLSFKLAPNFEAPADAGADNVYNVTVQVSDGTLSSTQALVITVTPVNDNTPAITSSATASVVENTAAVLTITASDADLPTQSLSYSLAGGADAALFAIDASTGALSFKLAPNFEAPADAGADNVYNVTVQVSDGTLSSTQALVITVTPVNDNTPAITSSATASVAENTTAVLTVTASDADRPAQSLSYSLAGGADAALFQIDASTGALSFKLAPNFEVPADAGADNVYNVTVQVSDGTLSSTQALAITVTPVNDNTPAITSSATASVAENTTAVLTVTASDADLPAQSLSYSLAGGADAALFEIDASTGALSFKLAPDYEAPADANGDNVYNVTVQVSDGTLSSTQALAITVTPVNDNTPAITSSATASVAENTTAVLTVTASDADLPGQTLTYAITGGADASLFTINASTGALSFLAAPDYEAPTDGGANNVYDVIVEVSDGSLTDSQAIAVTVTNLNEAGVGPVSDANAAVNEVAENAALGTTVGLTASASDPDTGDTLIYSLDDNAGGRFAIDAATGVLTVAGAIDREAAPSYAVTVRATSSDGSSATAGFTVNVLPLNDNTPAITSSATASVAENTTAVLTVTASDADLPAQSLSYSLAGGADAALFQIDASTGALSFKLAPDYEAPADANGDNVYELTVQVSDGTFSSSQALAISVTAVNDNTPAITSSATASVAENTTAVLTVTASDADQPAQSLSYSLAGGADAALFQIDASTGALSFKLAPDYEAPADANGDNVYELTVQVSDGTFSSSQALAISVTAVNDNTPAITSSATASVAENTTAVLTVTASDADLPAQSLSYSLAGGADAALFQIDASTGALSFKLAPNFEAPADAGADNIYNVTVQVSDGTFSSTQALVITVTPENDNTPALTSSATASVAENTTAVLTVTASDADLPAQSLSYSLAGGADAALFQIDASTGALSFKLAPNFEAPADAGADNIYNVTVQVSDGTFSSTQALAITVTSENDNTPAITSSATASVAENTTAVTTVTASDADLPAETLSYSLAGGADAALFQIDASTGALSFITAPDYEAPADAGADNVYNVTVQVSDGTFSSTQALAISVTAVNDNTPAITSSATASVAENTTAVLTVTASDADLPAQSLSYSLAGGADAALFQIDASTGALSFKLAPDYEAPLDANGDNVYNVLVSASDGSLAVTQTLAISVENRNEMPQGSDGHVSIAEDGRHVFVLADFGFTDPLDAQANGLAAVQILAAPGQGRFLLAGLPVADGQWITAGDILAGLLSYAPAANDNGAAYAALNFRVRDDGGTVGGGVDTEAGLHTLTIDVSAVNDLPVGTDDSYSLDEDTPLIVGGSGVLANDMDPDGDPLSVEGLAGPAHGTFTLAADGSFRYTPDADWSGTDSFSYRSFDGTGYGAPVTVRLVVQAINDAPIIESAAIEVMPGGSAGIGSGSLVVADSDSAAASIRIQIERVTGGHFELRSTPGVTVGEFGHAELAAGQVVFLHDGSATLPVIVLQANDGQASGPALSVRVSLLPSGGVPPVVEPPVVVTPLPVAPSPPTPAAPASPLAANPNPPAAARPVAPPTGDGMSSAPSRSDGNAGELAPSTMQAYASGDDVSRVRSYGIGAGMLRFGGAQVTLTLGAGTTGPLMEFLLSGEDIRSGTGTSSGGRLVSAEKANIPPLADGAYADAQLVLQAVELSGAALSVGVVWWATRAGGLVASLLMAAPAWRSFDPLPVLGPQDEAESEWGGEVDDEMVRDEMGAADVFDVEEGVAR